MSGPTVTPRSLHDILAGQPDEVAPPAESAERCRRSLAATRTRIVALDDDPTGSQVVHDVPVATRWDAADLRALLDQGADLSFVLTNSRAMEREQAIADTRQIAERILDLALSDGDRVEFVSRSDSTLRGHFPAETDALTEVLRARDLAPDVLLLCPAFPEAGRITVDGVHWVRTGGGYLPAGATEFAEDATFGYAASELPGWVDERTAGAVAAADVLTVTLGDLRLGGADRVAAILQEAPPGSVVAADAVVDADLAILASGIAVARETGRRILHRCGPSILAPLVGQQRAAPLSASDLATEIARQPSPHGAGGGIIVVGSHTSVSTGQLEVLLREHGPAHVELDVDAVLDDPDAEVDRVVATVTANRRDGDVVISTSRTRRDAGDPQTSLALARRVSDALVRVVRHTVADLPPRYLVAKGGITSSTVATEALDVRRAMVIGQMIVGGLPVWRLPDDSRCPGLPYVIFPGNVGDRDTLATVVGTLRAAVARSPLG